MVVGARRAVRLARSACGVAMLGFAALLLVVPDPFGLESGPGFGSPSGRPLSESVFASLWWVALVNVGICALGLATAGLWARPLPPRREAPTRLTALGLSGVLLAAVLAVGLRLPLASGSLWWDEAWSMRRVIAGQPVPRPDAPDVLEVEVPPWPRTLWDYRKPTNHVLYNVLGRIGVDAWRTASGGAPGSFDERAFRLPALVASGLGVLGVGVLTARLGFPAVAPAAALLLAIHPWHIKHGAEGRAYGLVLALSSLAGLALLRALRRGGWADWGGLGGALALLLYAQPSAIYLVACLGLATAAAIVLQRAPAAERGIALGRLTVVGVASAMALAQVLAPNVAQSLYWTDVFQEEQRISWSVIVDLWANVATGVPIYADPSAEPPEAWLSLPVLTERLPGLGPMVMALLPALVALGLVAVCLRSASGCALVLALLGGVALALLVTWWRHMYYYHRFLIFALVPFCIGACVGAAVLLERLPPRGAAGVWLRRGIAVALLLVFGLALWPQTRILLTRPYSPMREAALRIRELAGEPPSRVLRGGLGLGGEMPALYDPWLRSLQTPRAFAELLAQAQAEGRDLYVTYGYLGHNRPRFPDALRKLRDPACFEPVDEFRGIEPAYHYRVLRHRGVAARCEGREEPAPEAAERPATPPAPGLGMDEGGAEGVTAVP